jgi:hypothetical protein
MNAARHVRDAVPAFSRLPRSLIVATGRFIEAILKLVDAFLSVVFALPGLMDANGSVTLAFPSFVRRT